MREWKSQSHVRWYCKYHVVFSPKYRKKTLYGSLRKGVGKILRELCAQAGVDLVEGHAMSDHVHLCLSVPPKYKCGKHGRVPEGQVRDTNSPGISWKDEELHGLPLLGTWVLRQHGGLRRGRHSGLHPKPGR